MVPAASYPSEGALESHHECALSQVGRGPDMILDAARSRT